MIGVDVRIFNLNQLNDHICCGGQAFIQDLLHHVTDTEFQSLETVDFIEVYTANNVTQFFVDFVSTFQGGFQKPCNLLSHQNLKGNFWDKKAGGESLGIHDSCLYISLREVLEGVDFFDGFHEDTVEDIVDAGATKALDSAFLDKFTFNHFSIRVCEPIDQIQDNRALVTFD